MDAFLLVAVVLVLGLAIAPMFLMRGQYGKAKPKPGKRGKPGDSSGDGAIMPVMFGTGGGKGKSADNDGGSDAGSDGGVGGGGGDGGGD